MGTILVILLIGVVVYFLYTKVSSASVLPAVTDRQNYFFDHQKFSSQEFYALVEEGIKNRDIPKVHVSRVHFSEGGILSDKREYLRVSRKDQTFDICAAPFGTGFFVSYWHGEKASWTDRFPLLARMKQNKTYYQWDTENMYKSIVKAAVNEAIDKISPTAKGVRALSEISITAEKMTS